MGYTVLRPLLYGILMWAVCLYAFRKGGWAERLTAIGILLNSYITPFVLSPFEGRYRQVEMPVVIVDVALLVLLLFIALRSNKFWPLWLTAMQALTIFAHFAPMVPHVIPWAYYNAAVIWMYPMLIVLGFGVRQHHRSQSPQRRRGP